MAIAKLKTVHYISNVLNAKVGTEKIFDEDLIKRFVSIHEFYDRDINKFILLLRKRIYSYEYIDSWEIFNETVLPSKK